MDKLTNLQAIKEARKAKIEAASDAYVSATQSTREAYGKYSEFRQRRNAAVMVFTTAESEYEEARAVLDEKKAAYNNALAEYGAVVHQMESGKDSHG